MSDGYAHAAKALERVWAGQGSVKEVCCLLQAVTSLLQFSYWTRCGVQAVLGRHNHKLDAKQKRFAYALVCETLKFNEVCTLRGTCMLLLPH